MLAKCLRGRLSSVRAATTWIKSKKVESFGYIFSEDLAAISGLLMFNLSCVWHGIYWCFLSISSSKRVVWESLCCWECPGKRWIRNRLCRNQEKRWKTGKQNLHFANSWERALTWDFSIRTFFLLRNGVYFHWKTYGMSSLSFQVAIKHVMRDKVTEWGQVRHFTWLELGEKNVTAIAAGTVPELSFCLARP